MMGHHQQCACAASGAVPLQLLRAHACFRDRGAQLSVSAVSTALNAVDWEPSRGIRLAAAVKSGGTGGVVRLTLPSPSSSSRRPSLEQTDEREREAEREGAPS